MPWVKLVLFGKPGKVDPELQACKEGAWTSKAALTSREYDGRQICQVGEIQRSRVGSFVASPQGISSRNRMEASETGGGSETTWYLQALFGKG